jgi:hypothetical protein
LFYIVAKNGCYFKESVHSSRIGTKTTVASLKSLDDARADTAKAVRTRVRDKMNALNGLVKDGIVIDYNHSPHQVFEAVRIALCHSWFDTDEKLVRKVPGIPYPAIQHDGPSCASKRLIYPKLFTKG